jgi:hypothetical protein
MKSEMAGPLADSWLHPTSSNPVPETARRFKFRGPCVRSRCQQCYPKVLNCRSSALLGVPIPGIPAARAPSLVNGLHLWPPPDKFRQILWSATWRAAPNYAERLTWAKISHEDTLTTTGVMPEGLTSRQDRRLDVPIFSRKAQR